MRPLLHTLIFIVSIALPAAAWSADRVALVIGMAKYKSIPALDNTVNDALRLSETLRDIGFQVTTLTDIPLDALRRELDRFAFRAETADLALIYFAGHGVEVQGENFLIPVDARVASNRDIQAQSISLNDLLRAVDRARKMRIVILDSCRDNPFPDFIDLTSEETAAMVAEGTRSARGGMAPPTPDRGTLVAFAARDGEVALDGDGDNSPFALALSDKLAEPGLEISLMFRQVRDQVLSETGNRQEPHTYGSLSGVPFYLAGTPETRAAVAAPDPTEAWSAIRPDQEKQLQVLAGTGDTRAMIGLGYMRLNPDSPRFDAEEAVALFTRAAQAGSAEAQFELAKLYEKGIGTDRDEVKALELFRRAADQGFADAINDLGFMHYQGALGLPQDPQKALEFFEEAAELGHPQAMFNFAALIDDGLIPGRGPEDAAEFLYRALRSGSQDVFDILTERPTMFKDATRRALQAKLKAMEFYTGSIDGDFGPGTQRGLRRAYGLEDG